MIQKIVHIWSHKPLTNIFYLQEKEFIEPAKEIVLNRARNEYSTDMKIDSMQEKLDKSENEIIRLNTKIDEILNLLKRDDN